MPPHNMMNDTSHNNEFTDALSVLNANGWAEAAPLFLSLWARAPINMRYGLMAGVALLKTGRVDDGVAQLSYLSEQNPIIRIAQYGGDEIPLPLKTASRDADDAIRNAFTRVQENAIKSIGVTRAGRIATALWPQTHSGPKQYPDNPMGPKPYVFYAPDLPPIPVFDNNDAPWTQALAAQTNTIRDEFLALMEDSDSGAPYVPAQSQLGEDWQKLRGQKTWNAVHLYKDGRAQSEAARCPKTLAVLSSVPTVMHNDGPMEVFFSVLAPDTTIPPHFGLANCRVTVHLPLLIPDNCAIRVADITHSWLKGEPFIFDDSFDHSAWNGSKTDQRVVLIFEAWRPDMTEGEIAAVEASYAARDMLLKERSNRLRALWPR
ncbi:aspartyl/asparaginyl beta-hydroxylase domain-containing protein [Fretibacter rubidus]|uniref:aspartyl/asparaginyl beta-hydroxylase domain-containing protein n=1 Tax=Fretibacter rubidus TaxID=570162 RepID=UPI00352AAA89